MGDGTNVKSPFYHPLLTVQGYHVLRTHAPHFFAQPGTTLTTEAPASYTGYLQGLSKTGLGAVSYKHPPGLGTPSSQESTRYGMSPTAEVMLTRRQHDFHDLK